MRHLSLIAIAFAIPGCCCFSLPTVEESPKPVEIDDSVSREIERQMQNELAKQRYEREIAELEREASKIRDEKAESIESRKILDLFVITKPSLFYDNDFGGQPTIAFTYTNNTDEVVRVFSMRGRLFTPGRTIPWVEQGLSYEPPGGIEPGETKELQLSPNLLSDWDDAPRDRDDMVLELIPDELELANGTVIEETEWTEAQESRLRELELTIEKKRELIPKLYP